MGIFLCEDLSLISVLKSNKKRNNTDSYFDIICLLPNKEAETRILILSEDSSCYYHEEINNGSPCTVESMYK